MVEYDRLLNHIVANVKGLHELSNVDNTTIINDIKKELEIEPSNKIMCPELTGVVLAELAKQGKIESFVNDLDKYMVKCVGRKCGKFNSCKNYNPLWELHTKP